MRLLAEARATLAAIEESLTAVQEPRGTAPGTLRLGASSGARNGIVDALVDGVTAGDVAPRVMLREQASGLLLEHPAHCRRSSGRVASPSCPFSER